ncbi:MAG: RNA polymerase sigma factor [Pirellula sp.]
MDQHNGDFPEHHDSADSLSRELNEWIKRYKPLLQSIAAREIGKELVRKVDTSDVIQETLSAAQANFHDMSAKRPREIRGYLRRILLNKIEDLRRRFLKSKKRDVSRELSSEEISSDEFRQIASDEESPLDLMIDEEHFRKVMNAIRALPDEIQRVLEWRFERGMTFEQIGDRIGRSKDDVRMLIQRCIARLKKQLEES